MVKTIAYIVLGIIVVGITIVAYGSKKFHNRWFKERPSYMTCTFQEEAMSFVWNADTFENYIEKHVAMSIPAKIEDLPFMCYFQFDTGSPYSMIYSRTLESLKAHGLEFNIILKEGKRYVDTLKLDLGGNSVLITMLEIYENYGDQIEAMDSKSEIRLGTIGTDLLDNRITMVDFKNQKIQIFSEKTAWMSNLTDFTPFDFEGRRLMLPVLMGKKKLQLFYDSGASSFGLITSKHRFDKYTEKDSVEIQLDGNRFGESIPIVHKNTAYKISIAGTKLPLRRIGYIDMYAKFQRFASPFTRIGGWMGNKPFLNSTIIIDTQKEEFTIFESVP